MTNSIWLSFFSYTVITALSPGPNNILAINATGNYGIKQRKNLLLGIYSGFFCVMVLCGVFSAALASFLPNVIVYMKYLGAIYISWLAYHVAVSKPVELTAGDNPTSFFRGIMLQFVNVKIILWGITAFTGFVLPHYHSPIALFGFILLLSFIGDGATHIWAIAGVAFSGFLKRHWRTANISMAVLLLYSAIRLVLE